MVMKKGVRLDYELVATDMLSLNGWMHLLGGHEMCVDAPAVLRWRRRPCPCC